jgi:ribosomal protein S18 acetylase RimI-like enzyme
VVSFGQSIHKYQVVILNKLFEVTLQINQNSTDLSWTSKHQRMTLRVLKETNTLSQIWNYSNTIQTEMFQTHRDATASMSIKICLGARLKQKEVIAELAFSTLGDFMNDFLRSKREVVTLVSGSLRDDRLLVALKDDVVVGFSGLEHSGKSFINISFREAARILGLKAYAVVIFRFVMIFNRVSPSQVHVQSLAVSEKERSRGIGSRLLHFSMDYARSRGFAQVKLEVTGANPRARRLYNRMGFIETKVQTVPYPFSRLVGIGKVIEMIYDL